MVPPGSDIPALLKLLDDEHPPVRAAVKQRLASFGPEMERTLALHAPADLNVEPLIAQAVRLRSEFFRDKLLSDWRTWMEQPSCILKVEEGLTLLADYFSETDTTSDDVPANPGIRARLNELAALLLSIAPQPDFRDLAAFLFASGRFQGNEDDYYAAANSNLDRVLRDRRGNPILLACVMILVGARTGIDMGGCNFPAHFLARHESPDDGVLYLIDCFNGGKILSADLLIRHQPFVVPEIDRVVHTPATAEIIMSRVLRNLDHAFEREGNAPEQRLMRKLWQSMAAIGE